MGRREGGGRGSTSLLFDPDNKGVKPALRRSASDLAGWPEVNRIVHSVELDGEALRLYKLAWEEFKGSQRNWKLEETRRLLKMKLSSGCGKSHRF